MTSVNSPACLLARNHFYKNLTSSTEQDRPAFSSEYSSSRLSQRRITLLITMETRAGSNRPKELWVDIVLGSSKPPKPPAQRTVV